MFPVVEFWLIHPQITHHGGAVDDAVETRVKICWFRWFCWRLVEGSDDGVDCAGDGGCQVSNNLERRRWGRFSHR